MKKIILLGAFTILIASYSCQKSEMNSPRCGGVEEHATLSANKEKGGLCVKNNVNTLTNSNGEWSCPSPAKDCGKISPCNSIAGGGGSDQLHTENLSVLDNAIENGTLDEYLSTPKGANFFKRLLGGKGEVFHKLIAGELTMVKKASAATRNAYYLVIAKGINADRIGAEDVYAAYEYDGQ